VLAALRRRAHACHSIPNHRYHGMNSRVGDMKPRETNMKKAIHTIAAAAFAAILSLSAANAQSNAVQGEVRKIDEAAGKVTLKHGPIKNLGMEVGMTMTFRVKDPAMLKGMQVGDKVEFEAEQAASEYTVTKMQKSN
jgi:Cu/Ag efflux protein CusF